MHQDGVKAALPNTQVEAQRGCQTEDTRKYGPSARTDQNSRKKVSEMQIANLSDSEFKTLVVRMLRDFTEYGKCMREEMKATLSEIKKNPQGTNREGKETGVQINNLEHKEEIINQYRMKKQEFEKMRIV